MAGRLPNLLVPGVTKAGTTSLFWYLAQHPDVCPASVKEVNYFAPLRYGRPPEANLHDYARHFAHSQGESYRLEASPMYFYGGPSLVEAVRRTLPEPRILIALRDPTDRLWSAYRYKQVKGGLDESVGFATFLERCLRLRETGEDVLEENALYRALSIGRYIDGLRDWFDAFGDNVRVVFFEDLAATPRVTVEDLCHWLGLDSGPARTFDYGVSQKTVMPRSRVMDRAARALNRSADRLWHLNRRRRLKGALRNAYHRVNASRRNQRFAPEDRRRVEAFYAHPNELLAQDLARRGYRALPEWLSGATTPPTTGVA